MTMVRTLLEFLDAPTSVSWTLTPDQAMDFLKSKGLQTSFDYRDLMGAEHARAFTVAKMMDTDLLADVKASLDNALANGVPFKEWADTIVPTLQAKGWWGRKLVTDPMTGETIVAQLGNPSRLQTIYRTNMQSAYAAGAWDAIVDQSDLAPYLLYDAVDDYRTRPEHAAWDNTVLRVDDAWWTTHYPPNGWNCRCSVIQLSDDDLADLGMKVSPKAPDDGTYSWKNPRTGKSQKVPKGVDPGWNHNVGIQRAKLLAQVAAEKVASYPASIQAAAAIGFHAAAVAGEAVASGAAQATSVKSAAQVAKAAMAAQERTAATQIKQALDNNTPHLAKAIEAVQKTKAGATMTQAELLQAAELKAAKAQQSAYLAHWKQNTIKGKAPGPKAQEAFDALPEEAQLALKAQAQEASAAAAAEKAAAQAAAAAESAANEQIVAIATGSSKTLEGKAFDKVLAGGIDGMTQVEILAKVQADVATAKAAQVAGQIKGGLKKNLVAEKLPTPAQQAVLKAMHPEELDAFLKEVETTKAAAKAQAVPTTGLAGEVTGSKTVTKASELHPDSLTQIGPQTGSNAGGLFRDTQTGETWYIKTPASAEAARNEVLAGKLYQLAGVDVPELQLTVLEGKPAVASKIVDGLAKVSPKSLATAGGTMDGFAVDAWLANWDVVGQGFDNLLTRGWGVMRVDTGGALRFRAQGGLKGSAWGDTVTELDSLRHAGTNPQAAQVFGSITDAQLKASGAKLLAVDRAAIDKLVDQFGPADLGERLALKSTLRARLDSIADQLGLARKAEVAAPAPLVGGPAGKHFSAAEFQRITDSRVNGYTISTDGLEIEDHQVLLQHYTDAKGGAKTRLVAKLRGEGAARLDAKLQPLAGSLADAEGDLGMVREKGLAFAKSINSRAAKGAAWDQTLYDRGLAWQEATDHGLALLKRAPYAGTVEAKQSIAAIEQLQAKFSAWTKANLGSGKPLQAIETLDFKAVRNVKPKPVAPKGKVPGELEWNTAGAFRYQLGKSEHGRLVETGDSSHVPVVHKIYEGEGVGVHVRFVPDSGVNSISSRGLVHIDVAGGDLAAADKAMKTLSDLGVTITRTTEGERLGLYLERVARIRTLRNKPLATKLAKAEQITDQAKRNAAKLKILSDDVGYPLEKSPSWNPDGKYQAFGHGRTLQQRPDLDGPAMAAFERSHLLYTNVTGLGASASSQQWDRLLSAIDGGGMLSSQMERARRGLASTGSSVSADHNSGGANYIFTRIRGKGSRSPGVYFRANLLRRADSISYPSDLYGSVLDDVQRRHRAVDVDDLVRNAGNSGNETTFRDGLSLFDDLERIIFTSKAEQARAIADMRARGYTTWPDGRPLDQVLQAK